jgi:formylglycine-generating enzyme required for sulfatase activity
MKRVVLGSLLGTTLAVAGEVTFVPVPAGEFVRGFRHDERLFAKAHLYSTSQDFKPEKPAHRVVISRKYELSRTEITVGQFRKFVEATGYRTDAEKGRGALGFFPDRKNHIERFEVSPKITWRDPGFAQNDNHPVVCVSLRDAMAYCEWLSKKEDQIIRLPTEAEWEQACRAGSDGWYSWGTDPDLAYQFANVADGALEVAHPGTTSFQRAVKLREKEGDSAVYTAEVGSYRPNALGLHDLHGNVWEWCLDSYQEDRYERLLDGVPRQEREKFSVTDPRGPETTDQHQYGDWRVLRGGSWFTAPAYARCSARAYAEAGEASCYTGFRVLRESLRPTGE